MGSLALLLQYECDSDEVGMCAVREMITVVVRGSDKPVYVADCTEQMRQLDSIHLFPLPLL